VASAAFRASARRRLASESAEASAASSDAAADTEEGTTGVEMVERGVSTRVSARRRRSRSAAAVRRTSVTPSAVPGPTPAAWSVARTSGEPGSAVARTASARRAPNVLSKVIRAFSSLN